jgi:hypothetical protein
MLISDIKRAKDSRPFRPFLIHLADGRAFPVSHPDAVMWGEKDHPDTIFVWTAGDGVEWIDIDLATSISMPGKRLEPEAN